MFSPQASKEIEDIKSRYPVPRSAVLPALFVAQREYGWLSPEALEAVAQALGLPKALVRGVATSHTMFRTKPAGRHLIQICTNVACMLFGSEPLLFVLKKRFGLEPGGTSADGRFSLVVMDCIGACDTPPSMLIGGHTYTGLNAYNLIDTLESYK